MKNKIYEEEKKPQEQPIPSDNAAAPAASRTAATPEYDKAGNTAVTESAKSVPSSVSGAVSNVGYRPSAAVTDSKAKLDALTAPAAYESKWQGQIDDIIGKIMNREAFKYDVNEDALYRQYAEQYARSAESAAADTTGRAAAMTGGFGNSWASTVGASAYAAEMQKLNDRLPELYQLALDRYNAEGDALYEKYGLLSDAESADYGRYRDSLGDYITERGYLTDVYNNERSLDWDKYTYESERDLNFALTAADSGDFSFLRSMGIDTTEAEELYKLGVRGQELENAINESTLAGKNFANAIDRYSSTGNTDALAALGITNTDELSAMWRAEVDNALTAAGLELSAAELEVINGHIDIGNFGVLEAMSVPSAVIESLKEEYEAIKAYEKTVREQDITLGNQNITLGNQNISGTANAEELENAIMVGEYMGDYSKLEEYLGVTPGSITDYQAKVNTVEEQTGESPLGNWEVNDLFSAMYKVCANEDMKPEEKAAQLRAAVASTGYSSLALNMLYEIDPDVAEAMLNELTAESEDGE